MLSFDVPPDSDAELELLEYDTALEEYQSVLEHHTGTCGGTRPDPKPCGRCMELTDDQHYIWHRLMIINRPEPK